MNVRTLLDHCETRTDPRPVSSILLPNGTVAATGDWDLSMALAKEAAQLWAVAS